MSATADRRFVEQNPHLTDERNLIVHTNATPSPEFVQAANDWRSLLDGDADLLVLVRMGVRRALGKRSQQQAEKQQNATRVTRPPGSRFLEILPYLPISKQTMDALFVPPTLDMRQEYFDALAANRPWLARARRVAWVFGMVQTIALGSGLSLAKKILALWRVVK